MQTNALTAYEQGRSQYETVGAALLLLDNPFSNGSAQAAWTCGVLDAEQSAITGREVRSRVPEARV